MNGFGLFLWRDGRFYKGEYLEDKKHNYGIYYSHGNKKYEGFWYNGNQSKLGKLTKKDGSFNIGIWKDGNLDNRFNSETEIANKLSEIDSLTEETINRVENVINNVRLLFAKYLPNVNLESFLEF